MPQNRRKQSHGSPDDVQNGVDRNAAPGEDPVLSDRRSGLDQRDSLERRRRRRRMGDPTLRQGDSKVFKKYSQMKLQMKREALQKPNRTANEGAGVLGQAG